MPLYLSQQTLKNAVERLSVSAAASSLIDFLIFKRAFKIAVDEAQKVGGPIPSTVLTGTKAPFFVRAIEEFTLRIPRGEVLPYDLENPYYIPIEAKRDKTLGYRSRKYPSNGSADTASRWQGRGNSPVTLVYDTSPKEFKFEHRSEKELRNFFKTAADDFSGDKPSLLDISVWWFRFTDLLERFSSDPTAEELEQAFVQDIGLLEVEIAALFLQGDEFDLERDNVLSETLIMTLSFAEDMANPTEYLPAAPAARQSTKPTPTRVNKADVFENNNSDRVAPKIELQSKVDDVVKYLGARGFVFDPWQVAAFVTAVRTKPFIILAGISGTGKTKLPRLIADATGAEYMIVPVRPDWTDSSEILGYERLNGVFQPGSLLRFAKKAHNQPEKQFFFILDEMNIARVEYYLAEVLSHMEERYISSDGRFVSAPLAPYALVNEDGEDWSKVCLPDNLCIVGSVNMDESTFSFSKKVLDRSFVIEFSTVDLFAMGDTSENQDPHLWDVSDWKIEALSLAEHPSRTTEDVQQIIATLTHINAVLQQGQLQFGYRVRDEITMFCLAAQKCMDTFVTANSGIVDPLDLAIAMKVLPRIQGSGETIRRILESLYNWASPDTSKVSDEPGKGENIGFPFCAERIKLMMQRLSSVGFTSYWL